MKTTLLMNILIFFAKIIGRFWVFACIPFRAYARSVVYNYVLQNNIPLKRLRERLPSMSKQGGWVLSDIHGVYRLGYIRRRPVNKIVFYLVVVFIWGWLDDDSNHDTTDIGYIKTITEGDRKNDLIGILYGRFLRKVDLSDVRYGNAFDLGDVRAQHPFFNFWCTKVWNDRNTAMNFQYLFADY